MGFSHPALVAQGYERSSCMATLVDVHGSDQLGDGCYQQNSDLCKPSRSVPTIQGAWHVSFPILPIMHTFFLPCPEVFSDGTPPSIAGTREEEGNKKVGFSPQSLRARAHLKCQMTKFHEQLFVFVVLWQHQTPIQTDGASVWIEVSSLIKWLNSELLTLLTYCS